MQEATPGPHLFVVLGGSGDLMRKKLLPALWRLHAQGKLGEGHLLAIGRKELDDSAYRDIVVKALSDSGISTSGATGPPFPDRLHYRSVHEGTVDDYRALANEISALERRYGLPGNRVFYLALPPAALAAAITGLGEAGLSGEGSAQPAPAIAAAGSAGEGPGRDPAPWTRIVVEKPFGYDLQSARNANALLLRYFTESQIYRIDHYLVKETVQNLMVFRFANAIFESLWNRDRVDNVQITVAESIGVSARAGYYDEAGALRDMVQNHLTQLLSLTAMEIPPALEPTMIHNEKVKVLHSVSPIRPDDVVFGQYTGGTVNGQRIPGYRAEEGVAADSQTETFAALRLYVNNWRWQGVPFFLRTGKRLPVRTTQIAVSFRCPVLACFAPFSCDIHCNRLFIIIEPHEGFDLCFEVKGPGQPFALKTERLSFRYADVFGCLPEAYETVLLDLILGDQTLFVRADAVEAAWALYDPLLRGRPPTHSYAAGTWGPPEAEKLLEGREWDVSPC
jgi:glucose-6-phosphate 1-dehydrogenase